MGRYRKKPVVVEAWQWTGADDQENLGWISQAMNDGTLAFDLSDEDNPRGEIKTLEGTFSFSLGDWVIKGVQDELYSCKHDIFAATYERLVG
jgi:hypothetical protein